MSYCQVNKSLTRVDAYAKVTGQAKFGADLTFPDMLYGKVLRSKYPHARIKGINPEKALEYPGVEAVLTAKDIPNNLFGVIIHNQQVLAERETYYIGDGIAVVAARTREAAEQARELIEVEYEELPGIYRLEEARDEPVKPVHPEMADNQVAHHTLRKGDVKLGFAEAEIILEREYSTQLIEHAYLEPEAVIAVPAQHSTLLTIYGSVQNPYATRRAVAGVLQVPLAQIKVIQDHLGGSFGGKDENVSAMAARAALLALKTGKAVKMVNDRVESMLESYKRHPYQMKYKVGASKEGKILAMEIKAEADSGAYACQTPFVTWRSVVQATGPYEIPHVKTDTYGFYTNNVYTGAMRGYGSPQVIFAQESLLDELARELKIDPVELRLQNIYHNNSITASGQRLDNHQVSLKEVLERALTASEYKAKYREYSQRQPGEKKRGIGLAISYRGCSLGAEAIDAAAANIAILNDGSITLSCGLAENGQGLKTIFSQIAAEILGVDPERINYLPVDTSAVPDSGATVASRSTMVGGNAVKNAAEKLKKTFADFVAREYETTGAELVFRDEQIYNGPGKAVTSFSEAAAAAFYQGVLLNATGWYLSPDISWDEETGSGNPYFTYVYGCQIAEVEVDIGTGEISVLRITAAHDVGRAINPAGVRGQIYGGVMMGLGYGLMEEVETEDGYISNTNFDDYLIPTIKDLPEIIPIIVENPDPNGPFGAKSIGEPTLELAGAAIANAVCQATGKRIRSLPLNLERVLIGSSLRKGGRSK
ncbi:MAG: xanthine dehydrogenase family protein molybdopterin-binding subunit [Halanaerobiales bacterium]|nr:xanthine dehydrogenase family protein molybdopterin-binding subunit [Halanaerobiales bacterium]